MHNYLLSFNTGPVVTSRFLRQWTAISNYFRISPANGKSLQAVEYLRQLKADGLIYNYTDSYGENGVYLEHGQERLIIDLIEKLLKTGLFCDPVMEFYSVACPG